MKTITKTLFAVCLAAGCANVPIHAPGSLKADVTEDGVKLTWNDTSAGQLRIERSDDGQPYVAVTKLTGDTTEYLDAGDHTGARYRMLAYDENPHGGTFSKSIAVNTKTEAK